MASPRSHHYLVTEPGVTPLGLSEICCYLIPSEWLWSKDIVSLTHKEITCLKKKLVRWLVNYVCHEVGILSQPLRSVHEHAFISAWQVLIWMHKWVHIPCGKIINWAVVGPIGSKPHVLCILLEIMLVIMNVFTAPLRVMGSKYTSSPS